MRSKVQISAYVSEETCELLERYVRAHGVKKAHVIETALLHHLQALRELPVDVVIPPEIVVTKESFRRVLDRIARPPKPTTAMRALVRGEPGAEPPNV